MLPGIIIFHFVFLVLQAHSLCIYVNRGDTSGIVCSSLFTLYQAACVGYFVCLYIGGDEGEL